MSATGTDPRHPVIVGLGEVVRRPSDGSALTEPTRVALDALALALDDAAAGDGRRRSALEARLGAIAVVPSLAWSDGAPASRAAELLGRPDLVPIRSSLVGGNGPQVALEDVARRIAAGDVSAAVVCGAELMATLDHARRAGLTLDWPRADVHRAGDVVIEADRDPATSGELEIGLTFPAMVYPMIEDAIRRDAGRTRREQLAVSSALWARFSDRSEGQCAAWSPGVRTPRMLAETTPQNRAVSLAYPKLLHANMSVDQGAAIVVCSAGTAEELGVPRDRWTYVAATAQATDEWHVSHRPALHRSPAIAAAARTALAHAGTTADALGPVDLYSCFPSAVQIAAREIGLPIDDPERPLTCTGGLTFFGGPGNDYATHGIIGVARRLRAEPLPTFGLATALGWYVTKHAVGVYANHPPSRPFASFAPDVPAHSPSVEVAPRGACAGTAELRSILYDRDATSGTGSVFVRLADGRRALARTTEPAVLRAIERDDFPGRPVRVAEDRTLSIDVA